MNKFKAIVSALALAAAAGPALADCTSTTSLGTLGPPAVETFGNSFSAATKSFTDCYTFSLSSSADSFGFVLGIDPWLNKLDIDIKSVSLWGGALVGSLTDDSASGFNFGSLAAGAYTFAVSGDVTSDWGLYKSDVGYFGTIATLSVAAVPEPETYALMLLGLIGIAGVTRRRMSSN